MSHHPPCQYDRTFALFGGRICARCAGVIVGLPLGLAAIQMLPGMFLESNGSLLLVALATIALGVEIFVRNEVGQRQSGNVERVLFGMVMGAALVISVQSGIMLLLGLLAEVVAGQFYAALRMRKLGVLDRFITEYLEGAIVEHDRAFHSGRAFTLSCKCESHQTR